MSEYDHMSAAELHRERARVLRIVVLQRYMEMRIISTSSADAVHRITAAADCSMYERILKLDDELEALAAEKDS